MNRIYLLLCLLIALVSCSEKDSSGNMKAYELKGNVKSLTEYVYLAGYENGEAAEKDTADFVIKKIYNFNPQGECTDETYILGTGELLQKTINEYKDGQPVRSTTYDAEGDIFTEVTVKKINDNELQLDRLNPQTGQMEQGIAVYENGYVVKLTYPGREYHHYYDTDGKKTGYKFIEPYGELTAEIEYLEFDKQGNWTKRIERREGFDSDDNYVIRYIDYYN